VTRGFYERKEGQWGVAVDVECQWYIFCARNGNLLLKKLVRDSPRVIRLCIMGVHTISAEIVATIFDVPNHLSTSCNSSTPITTASLSWISSFRDTWISSSSMSLGFGLGGIWSSPS
jgi:hypothetical protein